jgi:hypothetical protein
MENSPNYFAASLRVDGAPLRVFNPLCGLWLARARLRSMNRTLKVAKLQDLSSHSEWFWLSGLDTYKVDWLAVLVLTVIASIIAVFLKVKLM